MKKLSKIVAPDASEAVLDAEAAAVAAAAPFSSYSKQLRSVLVESVVPATDRR